MNTKVFGATCLISGTTIGAGMLALPMTSLHLGFTYSIFLIMILWVLMVWSAGLMVDICQGKSQSIAALCGQYLGPLFHKIAIGTLVVLFWALLAAYIAGASSVLRQISGPLIDQRLLGLFYCIVCGTLIVSKASTVDYANRLLMFIKVIVFASLITFLSPFINIPRLIYKGLQYKPSLQSFSIALPIFFAAFGFHGSLPTIINYLDGNRRDIMKSIWIGSFIPLVVYMIWQAMTLGVLTLTNPLNGDVGLFIQLLSKTTKTQWFSSCIRTFTFLAITTSFLGVGIGMFDFAKEWFLSQKWFKSNDETGQVFYTFFTFSIPLVFALFYPQGFIYALGFASIFLSLLAVIFPATIALKAKLYQTHKSFYLHPWIVILLFIFGFVIILVEVGRS